MEMVDFNNGGIVQAFYNGGKCDFLENNNSHINLFSLKQDVYIHLNVKIYIIWWDKSGE